MGRNADSASKTPVRALEAPRRATMLTGVSHKMTTPGASHCLAHAFINMRLRVGAGADATLHLPVTCVSTILDTCRPSRRGRQKICQGGRDYKTKNENADDQIAGSNCAGHPTLSLRLGNTHAQSLRCAALIPNVAISFLPGVRLTPPDDARRKGRRKMRGANR